MWDRREKEPLLSAGCVSVWITVTPHALIRNPSPCGFTQTFNWLAGRKTWPRHPMCVFLYECVVVRTQKSGTKTRLLNSQILIHFNTGWTKISLELHLSQTLIPVIQKKSTIFSYGVIWIIIKRQVICLDVAADQDSHTTHYPFSGIILNILYTTQLHQTSNKTKKTAWILFKYSCDFWICLAQWNELISLSRPKGRIKQNFSVTSNWLKHLMSLSKIKNNSINNNYSYVGYLQKFKSEEQS